MSVTEPSFMDWMELLGLDGTLRDLFAGGLTIDDARDQVTDARDRFPGISQDYIALLARTDVRARLAV